MHILYEYPSSRSLNGDLTSLQSELHRIQTEKEKSERQRQGELAREQDKVRVLSEAIAAAQKMEKAARRRMADVESETERRLQQLLDGKVRLLLSACSSPCCCCILSSSLL